MMTDPTDPMARYTATPVRRDEIAAHVAGAFAVSGDATKEALVQRANETHGNDRVIGTIEALPDRIYQGLPDLWRALADLGLD